MRGIGVVGVLGVAAVSVFALGAIGADRPLAERLAAVKAEHYCPANGYSEGPTWRDGEVFFCQDGLMRVTKERQLRRYLKIGPAGTFLKADGHLLICDNKNLALLDLAPDGAVSVLCEEYAGKKLGSLNDVTVDKAGNVYWTDPNGSSRENPIGKVFRLTPDGKTELLADDLAFPNGLDVDLESKHLYVIESQTAKVLRYPLPPVGEKLARPTVFYSLGGSGGDGCAFDADGNLWVADFSRPEKKPQQGRITVLSPKGEVIGYVDVPAKMVSNVTFGGAGRDELFITAGDPGGVFRAAVGVKGFAGHPGVPMKTIRKLDIAPVDEAVEVKPK